MILKYFISAVGEFQNRSLVSTHLKRLELSHSIAQSFLVQRFLSIFQIYNLSPFTLFPYYTLPSESLPLRLRRGGVSGSLQCDTTAAGENTFGKKGFQTKMIEAKILLPRTNDPPPVNCITQIKRFWSKCPTTGPSKKSVLSIKIRKIVCEVVGVYLFYLFVFSLSNNVNFSMYLHTFFNI